MQRLHITVETVDDVDLDSDDLLRMGKIMINDRIGLSLRSHDLLNGEPIAELPVRFAGVELVNVVE